VGDPCAAACARAGAELLCVAFVDSSPASAQALEALELLAAALRSPGRAPLVIAVASVDGISEEDSLASEPPSAPPSASAPASAPPSLVAVAHSPALAAACGLVRGAALVPDATLLDASNGVAVLTDVVSHLKAGRLKVAKNPPSPAPAQLAAAAASASSAAAAAPSPLQAWPRNCFRALCAPDSSRALVARGPSFPSARLSREAALRCDLLPGDPVVVRVLAAPGVPPAAAAAPAAAPQLSAALYVNAQAPAELEDENGELDAPNEPEPPADVIELPPAVFADLGRPAVVSVRAYEMPTAESVALAPLCAEGAEPPAPGTSLARLRAFFGLLDAYEDQEAAERLAEEIGSAQVRVSAAESQWLEEHVRLGRCRLMPLSTGATIGVPEDGDGAAVAGVQPRGGDSLLDLALARFPRGCGFAGYRVLATEPRFTSVIVGPDTKIKVMPAVYI
jgi:hypothetical protein